MIVLFEIFTADNEETVTTPLGIFNSPADGFTSVCNNWNTLCEQTGNEISIEKTEDGTCMRIAYNNPDKKSSIFIGTYVARPYIIGKMFEDINLFDDEFYTTLNESINTVIQ